MDITIRRLTMSEEGTIGALYAGGERVSWTLELPWRDNASGLSCIPTGTYKVQHVRSSPSGKFHDVYHVLNVPGREGVLIHSANFAGAVDRGFVSELHGCIAPARRLGYLPVYDGKQQIKQRAALDSRGALGDLHKITERGSFTLTIVGAFQCLASLVPPAAAS